MNATTTPELSRIVEAIHAGKEFLISSHARPDGDAIGSSMAMAYALRALGKRARVVFKDPAPAPLAALPGVADIELTDRVDQVADAAIIMECGNLARTGVLGFERSMLINIDHHPGNDGFGQLNWFDASAAACGEMVYQLIVSLGVPLSVEIATHIYVAILTDTGSFHYSSISPQTFEICRAALDAGVDPVQISRQVYDSNRIGRLKLLGSMLSGMQVDQSGRIAVLYLDDDMLRDAGGTYDDTEGLINEPLTVKDIQAVVFFKRLTGDEFRMSLRSKGEVNIGVIAKSYGGGGHKNAAGCTVRGNLGDLKAEFIAHIQKALAS
jgi:bifunctional oligoribonuclease and PAP phosphatase NrnA